MKKRKANKKHCWFGFVFLLFGFFIQKTAQQKFRVERPLKQSSEEKLVVFIFFYYLFIYCMKRRVKASFWFKNGKISGEGMF